MSTVQDTQEGAALDPELVNDMVAILSSLGAAVALASLDGGPAWLSASAGDLLGLPPGPSTAADLDASLRALLGAPTDEDERRLNELAEDPWAVVTDWMWTPEGPITHLRVTTFSFQIGEAEVRVWVLDDVSAEQQALSKAESAGQALAEAERSLAAAQDSVVESEHRLRTAVEGVLDPHLLVRVVRDAEGNGTDLTVLVANQAALQA